MKQTSSAIRLKSSAPYSSKINLSPISVAVQLSIFSIGLMHSASHAATITVTSNLDDNGAGCTLREALVSTKSEVLQAGCINSGDDFANFLGHDLITFSNNLSSNVIVLANGQFNIIGGNNLVMDASNISGGITIDANQASRVFLIDASDLSIDNITITGGSTTGAGGAISTFDGSTLTLMNSTISGNSAGSGGGISSAHLSLINSTVSGNSASSTGGGIRTTGYQVDLVNSTVSGNFSEDEGGGLYLKGSRFGRSIIANISNSTIVDNHSSYRGGGFFADQGTIVNLQNSTISGNHANFRGGGFFVNGQSSVSLVNSTMANNSVILIGSGFTANTSTVSLTNSIVANTTDKDGCHNSLSTVVSDAASIIQDGTCSTAARSGNPGLLPLANNGGHTFTHALSEFSPARNTGILANCTIEDQRGQLRDDGDTACDVGAVEYNSEDEGAIGGAIDTVTDPDVFYVVPLLNGKTVVIPL